MTLLVLSIVRWNSWASLALGLPLNGLLLYLTIFHSSAELKEYRPSLYFFFIVNTLILLLQAFTQPVYFTISDGPSFIFFGGPASGLLLSRLLRHIAFGCYFSCFIIILASLTLQFLDRYLILCRGHNNRVFRHFFLSLSQKVFLIVSILIDICIFPTKEYQIDELLIGVDDIEEQAKIAAEVDLNLQTKIAFGAFVISLLASYLIILFCYQRIRAFIKRNLTATNNCGGPSIANRDSSQQIIVNMAIQAILPMYAMTLFAVNIGFMLGSHHSPWLVQLQMLTFAPINWLPLLNPLITILTIRTYRNTLLAVCRMKKTANDVKIFKTTVIGHTLTNNAKFLTRIN